MSDTPDSGTAVRMRDAAGRTVGVGVLVGPREILTCAHVVNAALGRDRRAQDRPAGEITVEPALADGLPLRARVRCWLPPPRTGAAGDDIAGLVLTGTGLPAGGGPAAPAGWWACWPPRRSQPPGSGTATRSPPTGCGWPGRRSSIPGVPARRGGL